MPRGDVSGCILRENQRDWLVGWLPSCSFLLKKMKSNSWQESNLRKIQINRIHREKKDISAQAEWCVSQMTLGITTGKRGS